MVNSIALVVIAVVVLLASSSMAGTFARIEARFELPQVTGDPFDFAANDVRATFAGPGGATVTLPAFFDGGTTWRVRHAPTVAGAWTVRGVTLNGVDARPEAIEPSTFSVAGAPSPGYVRVDAKDAMRFALDDGTRYYPIGYNLGWHHGGEPKMPPLVESIRTMGAAGVNWTRIWMNHWDGKNLDWVVAPGVQPTRGALDLDAARKWDAIVDAAEAGGVRFQLVLQHHGQYSTKVNENWSIHPWSVANGGFLADPTKFFVDEEARRLTRAKYRYIIARYGHSPAVMAWELFNEVEYTDAYKTNLDDVAVWHAEMAAFLREHDAYRHLITTSSKTAEPKLWPAMDYYQDHVYAPDLVTAVQTLEARALDRPYFYGEIGTNTQAADPRPGDEVHRALWASLMSNSAGAAQYWYWYEIEPRGLLYHYTAAQAFLRASMLLDHADLKPIEVQAATGAPGPFRFGPGSGWAPSKGTRFTVKRGGFVDDLGGMSSYLQGTGENRAMFPFAEFAVDYPVDGTFAVRVDEMTSQGATLNVTVDGRPAASLAFATVRGAWKESDGQRNEPLGATVTVDVPAGPHVVRLENAGQDWLRLREFTLAPYAPGLAVVAKGNATFAALWAYRREPGDAPVEGMLSVPGLTAGTYRVVWWETSKGVALREQTMTASDGQPLVIDSGPVVEDVAIFVTK